jgi:hypothetical protein
MPCLLQQGGSDLGHNCNYNSSSHTINAVVEGVIEKQLKQLKGSIHGAQAASLPLLTTNTPVSEVLPASTTAGSTQAEQSVHTCQDRSLHAFKSLHRSKNMTQIARKHGDSTKDDAKRLKAVISLETTCILMIIMMMMMMMMTTTRDILFGHITCCVGTQLIATIP